MISWVTALLVWTVSGGLWTPTVSQGSLNMTVTCTSCSSYQMSTGVSNMTFPCPSGTFCSTTNASTPVCSATNRCDGVVCDHYEMFPSSSSCQKYHICRLQRNVWTLVPGYCPGGSRFDTASRKCTLSPNVNCYNASATG